MMSKTNQNTYYKISILFLFSILTGLSYAQGEKGVGSVEINVVDAYKANIKQAAKISGQPDFKDTTTQKLPINYSIRSKSLSFDFNPKPIPAATIKRTRLPKLPQNLVMIGFGTAVTPVFEIYTGSARNKNKGWGAHAKYFYTEGGVKDIVYEKAPMREADINLFYKHIFKKYKFKADIDAEFDNYSYYGLENEFVPIGQTFPDLMNHSFNRIGGKVEYGNINSSSRAVFNKAGLSYYFVNDNFNTNEHALSIPTKWLIPVQSEDFYTDININYQKTSFGQDSLTAALGDSGSSPSFFHFQFMPKIKSNYGKLFFTIGLNINTNTESKTSENPGGKTRVYGYPEITADLDLVPGVLSIYAGWTGSLKNNSIWSLKEENPFISPLINLQATGEHRFFAGVKGKVTNNMVYNLQAKYKLIDNLPVFYRDPNTYNPIVGFQVLYDNARIINLFGELKYEADNGITIGAFADYNKYDLKNLSHAYHVPELKVGGIFEYNFNDKIIATTNLTYVGVRKAFDPTLVITNPNMVNTSNQLPAYLDMRLGAEYRYNKNLSAYFNVTNLLSQNYQIWYGYPVQQIRFLLGISYRF